MFENIIEQAAASQLKDDITCQTLAQSMLFFGPPESGKGSAALELARVLSCCKDGPALAEWKCACSSCESHRYLKSDDLLVLGKRNFSAEIAACCRAFLKNPSPGAKLLFYRSLRKLQIRFSPNITEDDAKVIKLVSLLQTFDEKLSDFLRITLCDEKLCNALVKDAQTLEEKGVSFNIPVGHIRQASFWCRLAPAGKNKMLIIENAENMRDEARNTLLKLLEEPPASLNIVLTSQRKESIIPTILSRLRPYRFLNRSAEGEKDVLRRVFQAAEFYLENAEKAAPSPQSGLISLYLDSFLPASAEKLLGAARWFSALDYSQNSGQTVKALLEKTNNFENDSFPRFLKILLDLTAKQLRNTKDPKYIRYFDFYKKHINEAATAVEVLNQSVALALEALLYKLKTIEKAVAGGGHA